MKLLITGAISWNEKQKREIQGLGHELIFVQDERIPMSEQGVDVSEIEGTICNGLFLYNDITEFYSLRYIQLTSAGFDRVPMDYVKRQKIEIHNAKGVYSIPMAEFAVSGVLQLYKQSRFFYENQKLHKWEKHRGIMELFGKTVCIVGCGNVGQECARHFQAFDCRIIGIDLSPFHSNLFMRMEHLDKIKDCLRESDVVILTLPLTDGSRHLINAEQLSCMKEGSILVNISRGGVVDTDALIEALHTRLKGAVLDVFEEEPIKSDNLLWDMENVILTPHNSFVGEGNRDRLQEVIVRNLRRELKDG